MRPSREGSPGDTVSNRTPLQATAVDSVSARSPDTALPASSTPQWLRRAGTPVPPACPATDACPLCFCDAEPGGRGPEAAFAWPQCAHVLHLGCAAHLAVNSSRLACPTCRAGWPPGSSEALQVACLQQSVPFPEPAPEVDTRSEHSLELQPPPSPGSHMAFVLPPHLPCAACFGRFGGRLGRAR